jgi:imidazolonepropionase-like amidohydrolase
VDNDLHARMAVEAGADGIEHIPPDLSDKTIQEMASKGITLTPTLSASEALSKLLSGNYVPGDLDRQWVLPEVLSSLESPQTFVARTRQSKETVDYFVRRYDRSREALRRAVAGHVTILAGSDAGNSGMFHGPALLRELELLVQEGGMSPGAALVAATGAGARRLGSRDIGRIAPGAFADMVVLEADPSRDIHALRKVRAVYFGGVQLQRDALLNKRPGSWSPLFSFPVPANDRSGLHSRTPQ